MSKYPNIQKKIRHSTHTVELKRVGKYIATLIKTGEILCWAEGKTIDEALLNLETLLFYK